MSRSLDVLLLGLQCLWVYYTDGKRGFIHIKMREDYRKRTPLTCINIKLLLCAFYDNNNYHKKHPKNCAQQQGVLFFPLSDYNNNSDYISKPFFFL